MESTIKVQLFHVISPSEKVMRGTASIPAKDSLPQGSETIVREHRIHQVGKKFHRGGSIVVFLRRKSSCLNDALNEAADEVRLAEDAIRERNEKMAAWCSEVLGCVNKIVEFGDVVSQAHPYLEMAWKLLTATHKALNSQLSRDDKIKTLFLTIRDMLDFVNHVNAAVKIDKLKDTVASMMSAIRDCALFIQEYGSKGFSKRMIRSSFSATTDDRIEKFITEFNLLKSNFDRGINIQMFRDITGVVTVLEDIRETDIDRALENLPGWNLKGVKFNESKGCLDGTRLQLLNYIQSWADSPDEKGILWLSGGAGTGKTSIANSIALSFDRQKSLGACFFFNRDTVGLNNPDHFFGSLCYQLAIFRNNGKFPIKCNVLSAIHSMGYVASSSLRTQARKLIVDPTNASELAGPVFVVIDALDESGTAQRRKELLETIAAEFPKLPRYVKIMITSRDELDIRQSLEECSRELCIDDAESTVEDIESYIKHRLTRVQQRSHLGQDWPGPEKLHDLANCAGSLFIWASVACNFVEAKWNPIWRLNVLLKPTSDMEGMTAPPLEKLDILYNTILKNAFPDEDGLVDFRYVIGSILALETPITRTGLDCILGLGVDSEPELEILWNGHRIHLSTSDEIISLLHSLVKSSSTTSSRDGPLRLLHPSLYEFLTHRVEDRFRINLLEHSNILAMRCLTVMNTYLEFNICQINDPSLLNKEIKDLPARIDSNVPDGLRYCCRSIGHHITKVTESDTLLDDALQKFISEHLLHWIEVMSLLGEVSNAETSLHALSGWVKDHASNASLQGLIKDSIHFIRNFGHGIRLSALHTYFSALILVPKTSHLSHHFRSFIHKVPWVPDIISSHSTWPTALVRVLEGHTGIVNGVMFSPDGRKLASASSDGTVRLWDVMTGQAIGGALEGHNDTVLHVAFSPDGKKLASASYNKRVFLWDLEDSIPVGRSLKDHTSSIVHIVFSPDGRKLGSASDDMMVQFWDFKSGLAIGKTLEGHTDYIRYVAFSPDGTKLASASYDFTVRLWDTMSGQTIGKSLRGHSGWIRHVMFSPDSRRLASASYDCTARIWDIESGQAISLSGHSDWICHTVFSPNGRKLASASFDTTVRLWDVDTGQGVGPALMGHTGPVNQALFSPDGRKVASVSYDKTVRLWDVESGQSIREIPTGHAHSFCHLAFSADGAKLALAGSYDKTVRLWEVEEHENFQETLSGHTSSVTHVTFSPDGNKLASASLDKTVWLWDIGGCMTMHGKALRGHTEAVVHVAFSPDGKILCSASDDYTLRLWNVESGQAIGEALKGHKGWIANVVFSPDGKKLASPSWDFTVRLWDVECGQTIRVLIGHTSWVLCVIFSPDGQKLASASYDQTVRIWDVESGESIGDAIEPSNYTHYTDQAGTKLQIPDLNHEQWIEEIFVNDSAEKTDSSRAVTSITPDVTFDELGFLRHGTKRILWLPVMLRGPIAVRSLVVAVGGGYGAITLIKMPLIII